MKNYNFNYSWNYILAEYFFENYLLPMNEPVGNTSEIYNENF